MGIQKPKTERFLALDGLRGFAALSVSLSHIGFGIASILPVTFFINAYRTLAVGPNSVQIFFVLSGFLIAFLYPSVPSALRYVQKRYARIVPILCIVVIYLSIVHYFNYKLLWYQEALALLVPAIILHLLWRGITYLKQRATIGSTIFFLFIGLQFLVLIFNLVLAPKYMILPFFQTKFFESLHSGLSYATLTMPFIRGASSFTSVLWSLPPEIYFYLLYPIISVLLIRVAKKYPWYIGTLIFLATIKILFDLDDVLRGVLNMRTMNISRTAGFAVGVAVGMIARDMPSILRSIFSHKFINMVLLGLLIGIQYGDWAIRDGQTIWFMNNYYLMSSIVVGLVVMAAIIKGTLIERLFSNKFLVFYGMISYSLYLTHSNVSKWVHPIIEPLRTIGFSVPIFAILEFAIILSVNALISFVLYQLVEALYLKRKRGPSNDVKKPLVKVKKVNLNSGNTFITLTQYFILIVVITLVYTSPFRPTQLGSHHSYFSNLDARAYTNSKISMLDQPTLRIPIQSKYDNLSVVILNLWYYKNADVTRSTFKDPAKLRFRLIDEQTQKVYSETCWNAYDVESESNYPFGFETISNSKGKEYIVELSLTGGSELDQIIFNASPDSIHSVYTIPKSDILKSPMTLIVNRIMYMITDQDGHFALIFLTFTFVLSKRKSIQFD